MSVNKISKQKSGNKNPDFRCNKRRKACKTGCRLQGQRTDFKNALRREKNGNV